MMTRKFLFLALVTLFCLLSCQQSNTEQTNATENANNNAETQTAEQTPPPTFAPNETDYLVTIETRHGTMKAILYDETPQHKQNFIKLANEGFYDGTLFHRVIANFMIQGGDPTSKGAAPDAPLGMGDPGYTLPAEFSPNLYHEKGALAAARKGDNVNPQKESNGSQFYIVQGKRFTEEELEQLKMNVNLLYQYFTQLVQMPEHQNLRSEYQEVMNSGDSKAIQEFLIGQKDVIQRTFNVTLEKDFSAEQVETYTSTGGYPPLDGEYTVFGKVIDGLEVIDKIAAEPTNGANRPQEDVSMKVRVDELPKAKIYELYGYRFGV